MARKGRGGNRRTDCRLNQYVLESEGYQLRIVEISRLARDGVGGMIEPPVAMLRGESNVRSTQGVQLRRVLAALDQELGSHHRLARLADAVFRNRFFVFFYSVLFAFL